MAVQTTFRFGELEATLAAVNQIPSVLRTKFQARLKNFHRLKFPAPPPWAQALAEGSGAAVTGFGQGQAGKAATYGLREMLLMAVAIELTQLGLTPERAIEVISNDEFPVWTCVNLACSALQERPEVFNAGPGDVGNPRDQKVWGFSPQWADSESTDPFSMFLYCDPAVLSPWEETADGEESEDIASATFFYAGAGIIRENITRWTTGPSRRLALINVTKLLFDIAAHLAEDRGLELIIEFQRVAKDWTERGDFDLDDWLVEVARRMMSLVAAGPDWLRKDQDYRTSWIANPSDLLKDFPDSHDFRRIVQVVEQQRQDPDWMKDEGAPDLIIHLPGQRQLMVDAKVSPSADIPQVGIWQRVDELAQQPYRTPFADKTKYVVLYIPSEHFYDQAAAADKRIFDAALEQQVIIATPAVLLNLLAEASSAWEKYRAEFPDIGEEEWSALQKKVINHGDR